MSTSSLYAPFAILDFAAHFSDTPSTTIMRYLSIFPVISHVLCFMAYVLHLKSCRFDGLFNYFNALDRFS
jgi:hypothetical protein